MKRKPLKVTIVLIVLVLIGFITLTQVNFLDYERPMRYDKVNQITFRNFRGLEFFQSTLCGNARFAYIKTTIDYEFEKDSIRVEALFHPSSSYVYNKKAFSKDLLTHEIYHFKITELYTRILKQQLSMLKQSAQDEIKDVISRVQLEERRFQFNYDNETFHSYVLGKQKKYERTVDSLLHTYREFKNPKIYINEK